MLVLFCSYHLRKYLKHLDHALKLQVYHLPNATTLLEVSYSLRKLFFFQVFHENVNDDSYQQDFDMAVESCLSPFQEIFEEKIISAKNIKPVIW